jgi:hypothetical protein
MNPFPSLFDLQHLFFDEKACVSFLIDQGVFVSISLCRSCGNQAPLSKTRVACRCNRSGCRLQWSTRHGTFFANSKFLCSKILLAEYLWLGRATFSSICNFTVLSSATVVEYTRHFRQFVVDSLDDHQMKIGGNRIVVELDEAKLGKRKFHRGHHVDGI